MIVYPVTAYRNADREEHSYLVGVYSTAELAKVVSEKEEEDRCGKYCCEIIEIEIDSISDPLVYFKTIKQLKTRLL